MYSIESEYESEYEYYESEGDEEPYFGIFMMNATAGSSSVMGVELSALEDSDKSQEHLTFDDPSGSWLN